MSALVGLGIFAAGVAVGAAVTGAVWALARAKGDEAAEFRGDAFALPHLPEDPELLLTGPVRLASQMADCLADCIDTPLLTLADIERGVDSAIELRLGSFNPALSERAATLLEEAGR